MRPTGGTWIGSTARRALVALILFAAFGAPMPAAQAEGPAAYGETARPASCQPGDRPETGVQGEVTKADRDSGRSALGYTCNLSLLGQSQGQGTSWVNQQYGHCAYVGQSLVGNLVGSGRGVRVLDVSDPSAPQLTALLTSPAMAGDTWESLRVNPARGLLAAVAVGPVVGALFFDIYDIATDCAHPKLLNSVLGGDLSIPANVIGHEGGFSPDGRTYWSSGVVAGSITAIDVSDPTLPHLVWTGVTGVGGHGFDISADGNRMYLTSLSGFTTLDISQVQRRAPLRVVTALGSATWPGTVAPQHTISVTYRGAPWIIAADEIGQDGIHFVDNSDPTQPVVHPGISLEIERPANAGLASAETGGDVLGLFGYSPHYCAVDRIAEPTALACGYFQSGIRVFDIRDLARPREIAYLNPPARTAQRGQLLGSWHGSLGDLTADWCTSPPAFVGDELWVTCQDNGFMALRFAPGVYPLAAAPAVPAGAVNAPTTPSPTSTPSATAAPPGETLPATGRSSDLLLGFGLLAFALGLRALARTRPATLRRGMVRAAPVVLVALVASATAFTAVATRSAHADGVEESGARFASAMIDHHDEAIAMAHAVERDPRTTATNRALAVQVAAQQASEVAVLSGWLRQHAQPVPGRADHEVHAAAMVTGSPSQDAPQFNAGFVAMMAAHHRTAIPLARSAARDAEPAIARLASSMLVDQTIEVTYLDRVLGTDHPDLRASPYVCELGSAGVTRAAGAGRRARAPSRGTPWPSARNPERRG
jgi:uncharacterized protein (DUF305 family)